MKLIETINNPADLRKLEVGQLPAVAAEIRGLMLENVSQSGGHLSSSLGAVDLTVALHYCFNTPDDKLVWDVGHQAYAHKILTGRREQFKNLRQFGGISGFPRISESAYDAASVGHASTSISVALGLAMGRDLRKEKHAVVAIIENALCWQPGVCPKTPKPQNPKTPEIIGVYLNIHISN